MPRFKDEQPKEGPSTIEVAPRDLWVWVEGRVYVEGYLENKREAVDRARQDLSTLGLVLHEQDGERHTADSPRYRRWSNLRIPLEEAAALLDDHPDGITIPRFSEELFSEPGWTDLHRAAAMKKTYIVVHKLQAQGLLTKKFGSNRVILLFSTKSVTGQIPAVLKATAKNILSEQGISLPDRTLRKLIKSVVEHFDRNVSDLQSPPK